jgi:DNA-binding CsgD family transcriptional regulator/tetratricopeptide (TPR) repeat protein
VPAPQNRPRHSPYPVGRNHEQRVLTSVQNQACSGRGRLVLIGGEAGIGKTTLVEQFIDQTDQGDLELLTGCCFDVASNPPYALWRTVLEKLPEIGDWFDPTLSNPLPDQSALFQATRSRLEDMARERPILLVLEDAHWADQESLDLLRFIGQRVREMPLLIIVTYRNDEIRPGQPFYETLLPLVRECGAERIDLRRFRHADIETLVQNRYPLPQHDVDRLVDVLSRRTGGNPLFIVELLRSMEITDLLRPNGESWHLADQVGTDVPLLVRQLIEQRLKRLSSGARETLDLASVLGVEIYPDMLVAVSQKPADEVSQELQQALDATLLEQSNATHSIRFRHALIQEALYDHTPILWRQTQHRIIAEQLAERTGVDPSQIAEHFRKAGDPRAAEWSLVSARHARRLFAPHAVIQHLNPVLAALEQLPIMHRIEAFGLRGWAFEMTGSFQQANDDYHAELEWALHAGDNHARRDALVRLAELWTYRDYQRVAEYVEQALQVTEDINDHSLLAQTHNRFGTWYLSQDDPERARAHHQRAVEICLEADDRAGLAQAHDLLGLALSLSGNLKRSSSQHDQSQALLQELDDRQALANSLANIAHLGPTLLADMATPARSLDECIIAGEQSLRISREIDYRSGMVYARVRLIAALGARGDYQQALEMVDAGIEEATRIGNQQLLSATHAMAGLLWVDLLNADLARSHAEQVHQISMQIGSTFRVRMGTAILALSELTRGDIVAADDALQTMVVSQTSAETLAQYLHWRAMIELDLVRGDARSALERTDLLLGSIPDAGRANPAIRTSYLRGCALNNLQQFEQAIAWLVPARDHARTFGARSLLWRIEEQLGHAWLGLKDRTNARIAFTSARRTIDELSTAIDDSEIRSIFWTIATSRTPETAGSTPLQVAKHSSGGLTRRQRQVAALVAAGKANREIAESLSISERTVESHVSAILATLGLQSRAQIVAWCLEHDLAPDPDLPG